MKTLKVTSGLILNAGIPVLKLARNDLITRIEHFLTDNADEAITYINGYKPDYAIVNRLHLVNGKAVTVIETKDWDTRVSMSSLKGVPGITVHSPDKLNPSIIIEPGFDGYIDIPAGLILTVDNIPDGISEYDFNEADTLLNKVMTDLQSNAKYWSDASHDRLSIKWEDLKDFADSVTFGVLTTLDPCSDGEVYDLVTDTYLEDRLGDIFHKRPFTPTNVKLLSESGNYEFHDHYYGARLD